LSRLDTDDIPIKKEPFSVSVLIVDVVTRLHNLAESHDIQLTYDVNDQLPEVEADSIMIERVLSNLIENAINFSPLGGEVAIKCEVKGPQMQITIKDTGVGIPVEDQPFIFDRFFKVARDRSRTSGGSGLGLAIVKKVLDLHNSAVNLKSIPGRGTEVSFYLPTV